MDFHCLHTMGGEHPPQPSFRPPPCLQGGPSTWFAAAKGVRVWFVCVDNLSSTKVPEAVTTHTTASGSSLGSPPRQPLVRLRSAELSSVQGLLYRLPGGVP